MSLQNHSLFILVPAKDEADTLPKLLNDIRKNITTNIVVVDNNSKDTTATVAKQFTKHVVFEQRAGYGNACLAGIKYLNNLPVRPEFVCFYDGDGQSLVSDIVKTSKPVIESKQLHYCQGSRMIQTSAKTSLTGSAYVANKMFAILLSKIWRQSVTDLGPLRCISFELLQKLHMTSKTYAWTIEMNTKLGKLREPILEVPVNYQIRKHGKSKISGSFKTALRAAFIMSIIFIKTTMFWSPQHE